MSRVSILATPASLLLASLVGCMSPQGAEVHWHDDAPTTEPSPTINDALRGKLVVRTEGYHADYAGQGYDHRGYTVFDEDGREVTSMIGLWGDTDVVPLRPGRYIVVSRVDDDSLTGDLESRQVEVGSDAVTTVDFARHERGDSGPVPQIVPTTPRTIAPQGSNTVERDNPER